MGKKRSRGTYSRKINDLGSELSVQHSQSLVDDVRETRDLEFIAEKKKAERAKRRRLVRDQQLAVAGPDRTHLPVRPHPARRLDVQKEGVDVWEKAALCRKSAELKGEGEKQDVHTALDATNLNRSGLDFRTSTKIAETAKEQRDEIRKETLKSGSTGEKVNTDLDEDLDGIGEENIRQEDEDSDCYSDSDEKDLNSRNSFEFDRDSVYGEEEYSFSFFGGARTTEEEERALTMFSPDSENAALHADDLQSTPSALPGSERIMLADIIIAKIREREEADVRAAADAADPARVEREKKIAEVYGLVGNIMSKYRSGKVPKAFKVIPKQTNWEDLIYLTRPDEWTPAAVYVATRLLASNLRPKQVVRYYTDILLPRCLEDISENKKLNYHLYKALGKAIYKPEAFCKGIVFPLCEDPSCTPRQATIIASVIAKVSIPMLHSAAALLYICQLPYTPPNSIIITALIEKKYALPYRVLDAVVDCFLRMKTETRVLPLIWHQSLLSFAQRYKTELSMEQKESFKLLMRVQTHHAVTPEIRRELFSSRNRGDLMDPDANTIARNIASAAAGQ